MLLDANINFSVANAGDQDISGYDDHSSRRALYYGQRRGAIESLCS